MYSSEVHFSIVDPDVQKRRLVTIQFDLAIYKYMIFFEFSYQPFVRLIVVTAAIAPAPVTPTSTLVSTVSAAALIVTVVPQVQPLSAVSLIIIVVLFMMVTFTTTTALFVTTVGILAPSVAAGVVPTLRLTTFTITSAGRVSITGVRVARRISVVRRLIRGLVS